MDEKQKRKILIMQIGAGSLTCLILVLWIFNLKNVWQNDKLLADSNSSQWSSLKSNLDKTLVDVRQQLNQIDKNKKTQAAADNFLADLVKETGKISSSSAVVAAISSLPVATSSPVTTSSQIIQSKNKNCPEYINCMPTIGAARPCQIPAGCEGITVIAY